MDLSQLGIDTTTTGAGAGIDMQSILSAVTVVSVVIGGLFFVLYLINLLQHMRVNRAMIGMHKDVAEIRKLLEQHQAQPAPVAAPAPVLVPAPAPATESQETTPAPTRDESESSLASAEHTS